MYETLEKTNTLEQVSKDVFVYLQRPGTWGRNNPALLRSGTASMVVDTTYDLLRTCHFKHLIHEAVPATAHSVDYLVNTHGDGDHTYGNQLFQNSIRIASISTAQEMKEVPSPGVMGQRLKNAPEGSFMKQILGDFEFTPDIVVPPPTQTFERELTIQLGSKPVHLLVVGPAHTRGDTIVYSPQDRVVFTGDIIFVGLQPIIWAGPTENWLRACDYILDLDADVIVPGHGTITDKGGVRAVRNYLEYVYNKARGSYEMGTPADEAAKAITISLPPSMQSLRDGERMLANIYAMYREFEHKTEQRPNVHELFREMGQFRQWIEDQQAKGA